MWVGESRVSHPRGLCGTPHQAESAPHVPKVPVCVRTSIPTYSCHVIKAGQEPATTYRPFPARGTHPSSEGPCNPGRGMEASRVYPLDVGRNGVPARVTINHTYIKSFLLQTYRHRITNIHRPAPFRPQLRKGAWTMNDRGRPYHRAHSRTW